MSLHKPLEEIFPQPPTDLDPTQLDVDQVPQHIAVIMDGNGRWAQQRGKNRLFGHKVAIRAVRECIRCASDMGVRYLTIYSFSSENWKRPADEVHGLMDLFARTMLAEIEGLYEEHVRVMTIGHTEHLPAATQNAFKKAWERTKDDTGMTLVVAVNYGARAELTDATTEIARQAFEAGTRGESMPTIDEDTIAKHLDTAAIPDPDLVIRTSGEMRLSNFLLWQVAYSEFYRTDVLWPDFNRYDLLRAVLDYQGRSRRFGGVK
ncbi:MAG: isoprenyl transferase [Eggerthellaceae bacterium]|jgi:undecaprenyl diphosphate synthase|nr:isoprenyl transferase [Eggerthellaceae bacterium]MCH4220912.1 isoprenyl transferase [Eggerthellaceae bacterium]